MDEVDRLHQNTAAHSEKKQQKNKTLLGSTNHVPETYLEVSTPSVVLIELALDSQRKTTQRAPNGKRVAP